MLHRIFTLILKELQTLLSDPQSRAILVVPVLLQLLLFPKAATLEVKNNALGVYNQDNGRESLELIQRIGKAQAFSRVEFFRSDGERTHAINNQDVLLALEFPADFSRKLAAGASPSLQIILDGRRSNSGQIALSYIQEILSDYMSERSSAATLSTTVVRNWFNPNLDYFWFIVPSLIALITNIGTLIITALSLAREREQGTFEQLLVSPLTPGMIMLGKAVPAIIVAVAQGTVILLGGVFLYGISFQGSLLLLYGSMIVYIISLVGFGLAISSVCATQQQAFLGMFAFIMPSVLLSGYTSPIENMPLWLQKITWINPLRHFNVIAKGIYLKDMTAAEVFHNVWPMLVIAAMTLSLANWAFRRLR
ncbi:MAG: ABC transporter permease [Chthoniobacteraceae bacterium]